MSWAALAIGLTTTIVGAAASYGVAQASQPNAPDSASSSRELSNVNAALLPIRRRLEAAAQQGARTTLQIPVWNGTTWVNQNQTFDFRGMGEADIQGQIASKMAELQLELSQKYDHQFIEEALKQAELADPESFAARRRMNELIQSQIEAEPDRPVAEMLDKQIMDQIAAARDGKLDAGMKAVLDDAVGDALTARGGESAPGANFEEPLTTGFAGEQRQREAAQRSLGWLSSGGTPEDVKYRREQQNLANLSASVNGQTPVTQFQSLSGAQRGPTPFVPGQTLPGMPQGQGGAAQGAALDRWGTQMQAEGGQVNNWLAGITGALNLGGRVAASR